MKEREKDKGRERGGEREKEREKENEEIIWNIKTIPKLKWNCV